MIDHRSARWLGTAASCGVLALEVFNNVACYHRPFGAFLLSTAWFILPPLLPALLSLWLANPLRAVGACALFAPWLVFAYYTDCVRPYAGGGASMVYVAVLFWGTPSAILGALVTGPLLRWVGVEVVPAEAS